MQRKILILLFLFFPLMAQAGSESLYFIYPDGGSGEDTLQSGLKSFFDYLGTQTKKEFSGVVYKNSLEAENQFESQKVDMAVVSFDFFKASHEKFHLKQVAQIIPFYSEGPYEKLYMMAPVGIDVESLLKNQNPVTLVSTQKYDPDFLEGSVFHGDEMMKNITWKLAQTPDILLTIKKMLEGGSLDSFVLLTGFEFSAIQKMKKTDEALKALKLVFTSPDLPPPTLVVVDKKITPENLGQIKKILFGMSDSLNGLSVLKKLRMKGFAEIP